MKYFYELSDVAPSAAFPSGRTRTRPFVSVTFRPDVVVRALVDTGTDTCVFHANLLERIGLKLKDGNLESITAGRASLPVYYFDLRIGVDGLGAFETCIGFSDRVRPEYGLLWIYGFLDRLDAEFCEDYFILKRRGESR